MNKNKTMKIQVPKIRVEGVIILNTVVRIGLLRR